MEDAFYWWIYTRPYLVSHSVLVSVSTFSILKEFFIRLIPPNIFVSSTFGKSSWMFIFLVHSHSRRK